VVRTPRVMDATSTQEFLARCSGKLEENPRLILDFSETTFLSSAGLAAMAHLNRSSRARGGELRVASCSSDILHGIKLVRLDTVVPLYNDVSAAASAC
jgi:N-acetylglucosaminyldiphosphoundecaprenol N-acetyl-beta-D-mannosaminyltransferase